MNIRPLYDKLLVERQETQHKSEGGIILTSKSEQRSHRGKVIAAGPGRITDNGERIPMDVKQGDQILFNEGYGSKTEKVAGHEYLLLSESDVLAIVE